MKQIFLARTGRLSVEDVPAPPLFDEGILVQVANSLVSAGSEGKQVRLTDPREAIKKIFQPEVLSKAYRYIKQTDLSRVVGFMQDRLESMHAMGYSAAGTVVEVGPRAGGFRLGDKVACAGLGWANHAEVIAVPRNLAVPVPAEVTLEEACFVALGAIAMHGIRRAEVELGDAVAVIGVGLLGQIVCQILKAAGARTIGIDVNPAMVDAACALGLARGLVAGQHDVVKEVADFTGGLGADAVIICADTPANEPINLASAICRDRARIVTQGYTGMGITDPGYYDKELGLLSARGYGPGRYDDQYEREGFAYPVGYVRWTETRNMEQFLSLVAERKVNVRSLITHRYPFESAVQAYETVSDPGVNRIAVVFAYSAHEASAQAQDVRGMLALQPGTGPPVAAGRIRVGLIGCGQMAKLSHLPKLARMRDYHIRAVASHSNANAKLVATRFHADYCATDHRQIVSDDTVDAVFVTNRHGDHARVVLDAIEAGKAVFVEKPMVTLLGDLAAVRDALNRRPVKLMVGLNRRFAEVSTRARAIVAGKRRPAMITYRVNAGRLPAGHWSYDPIAGGGRVMSEFSHYIDWIRWLLDAEPTRVLAERPRAASSTGNDDDVSVMVNFSDGSVANLIYSSLGPATLPKERVEILVDGTALAIEEFRTLDVFGREKQRWKAREKDKGVGTELKAFARYMHGEDIKVPGFYDGAVGVVFALTVGESLRSDRPVPFTLEL